MAAGWIRGLFVGAVAGTLGMTCQAPPDLDGTPPGSQSLVLERWQRDTLDCSRLGGDCADWYAFETPGPGTLRIDLAKVIDENEIPHFSLVLGDASGRAIVKELNGGRSRLLLRHPPRSGRHAPAGRFTLAVQTPSEGSAAFEYELRVSFEPKPQPKRAEPRFRPVRATLLELETRPDGGEAVLLDKGSRAGLERGQRGRLLQGGAKIAEFEIIDVYPDGSRAAIRGSLGAALTPSTVAEVDVPL